jgi:hypothetical protein
MGATSSSYVLGAGDVGHTIRSVVTASNAGGSASAGSAQTAVVVAATTSVAPLNVALPTISGAAQQGQTLTASPGSWNGDAPIAYSYQWQRDGSANIADATGSSYTAQASDVGHTLDVVVAASNDAGTASATSAPTASITASTGGSGGCDLNATTSNFASQVSAAQAGQTICLASGNYGTWSGTNKAITVKAAQGATPTMTNSFTSGGGFTLDGISGMSGTIYSTAHDITIQNSTVTGEEDVRTSGAGILFDHDHFPAFVGTVRLLHTETSSSMTVQNSTFDNPNHLSGVADGIKCDAGPMNILNNDFSGINDEANGSGNHGDPIQNDGGTCVMKGNYFHDMLNSATCSYGEWDGGSGTVFENNVVEGGPSNGCFDGIDLLDDHGGLVDHNVFSYGSCLAYACGTIMLGGKTSEGAGSGTVIRDNICTNVGNGDGGLNGTYYEDHNLCRNGAGGTGDLGTGAGDIKGSPTFVGAANPTTFAGYALAPGSPGIGAASDGTNIGIELPTGG